MNYRKEFKLSVIITGLLFILLSSPGFAEEQTLSGTQKDKIYYDPATVSGETIDPMNGKPPIQPVKISDSDYQTGIIDRIDSDRIVIDDSLYKYAKGIKFLSRQGAKIETRWFQKGDKIRFVINEKYEAIILRKL